MLVGVTGAGACAAVLHAASTRADAAAVVPIALVWGALALLVARTAGADRLTVPVLVLIALSTRLPLVSSPPHLSDDLFRYLWEGRMLASGLDPFTTPPAAVRGLDDALAARVNHPEVTSIYPPVALGWFRLLDAFGGRPETARLGAVLADAVTTALLAVGLRSRGRSPRFALLWALLPLPVLESAANAHLEAPAVALAVAAVVLADRARFGPAGAALGLAAAFKLFPALLVPAWLRAGPRAGAGLIVAALVGLGLAWPVLDAGPALLHAFRTYTARWSFNGLVYPLVAPALGELTRPALLAAGAVATVYAYARHRDPVAVWHVVATAFLALTPTAHPWYAAWALAPSLLLGRWAWAVGSVGLVGAYAVLSTWDPATASWTEPAWLAPLTWAPWLVAAAAEARAQRSASRNVRNPTAV